MDPVHFLQGLKFALLATHSWYELNCQYLRKILDTEFKSISKAENFLTDKVAKTIALELKIYNN